VYFFVYYHGCMLMPNGLHATQHYLYALPVSLGYKVPIRVPLELLMMGWLGLVCFVLMRVRTNSKRYGRSFAHVLDSETGATLVGSVRHICHLRRPCLFGTACPSTEQFLTRRTVLKSRRHSCTSFRTLITSTYGDAAPPSSPLGVTTGAADAEVRA